MKIKNIIKISTTIFYSTILILPLVISAGNAHAEDKKPTTTIRVTQSEQTAIIRLKEKANTEIDRRVNALERRSDKIQNIKKLSSKQKTELSGSVSEEITKLKTLKEKINADTDLQTLKKDVQSVIDEYRIFALYLPKIDILVVSDSLLNVDEDINNLLNKFATRISDLKSKGSDTAELEKALADARIKLAESVSKAKQANELVLPLLPSDYPGSKATLLTAKTSITLSRDALKQVRKDIDTIRSEIRGLNTTAKPTNSMN